jgi:hypothetical protein
MTDDLVKRLRNPTFGTETTERNLMGQAAARIEELEAKLARVIGAADAMADAIQYQVDIYDASMDAEAALKSYRATLKGEKDE